jgi:phage terminase large subunit-like protein
VAPLFESGIVWAPDRDFAEEVVEQCAAFPYGDHDDLVDCTTQALLRFRQSGLLQHPEDYIEETTATRPRTYY